MPRRPCASARTSLWPPRRRAATSRSWNTNRPARWICAPAAHSVSTFTWTNTGSTRCCLPAWPGRQSRRKPAIRACRCRPAFSAATRCRNIRWVPPSPAAPGASPHCCASPMPSSRRPRRGRCRPACRRSTRAVPADPTSDCLISPKDQLGAAANLLYQDRAGAQPEGGSGSVNGFFRKVARFAVSKMAAFCYAVAVGVAGNLVFNYVQTHQAAPSIAALPHEAPAPAEKSPTVVPTATPSVMPAAAMIAKPPAAAPDRAAKPATVSAPVAPSVAPLPEPPANLGLPSASALSAPPLKPAALPSPAPAAIATPDRARLPPETAAAAEGNAKPAAAAALPPLGPAIEVASPPGAPAAPSTPIALLPDPKTASPEAAEKPPPIKPGPGSGGLY